MRGRKRKEIREIGVEEIIEEMATIGATNKEIANFLEINQTTLVRNYEKFLTKGRANLKIKLRRKIIEIALKGNVAMLIFLAKNYLDMKDEEKQKIEVNIKTIQPEANQTFEQVVHKQTAKTEDTD